MEKQYKLLPMTFFWMFLGLLSTAFVSFYSYQTNLCYTLITQGYFKLILILELVVVLLFSFLFKKLPPLIVTILYFVYALINGLSLSSIFYIFELKSIVMLFIGTAVLFAGLSIYGYLTKADLSRWGTLFTGVLIVGLILSLINLFLGNTMLDIILDWVILLTFFGITIYDMNKIKMLAENENIDENRIHIYCAMQLYLDFINIFLRILSLFGKKKD